MFKKNGCLGVFAGVFNTWEHILARTLPLTKLIVRYFKQLLTHILPIQCSGLSNLAVGDVRPSDVLESAVKCLACTSHVRSTWDLFYDDGIMICLSELIKEDTRLMQVTGQSGAVNL